jgi:hypothetical protein
MPGAIRPVLAAAYAERLMPLYEWISGVAASADVATIRSALELAWSPGGSVQKAKLVQQEVQELIPDEDDECAPADVALVENATTAVAYAVRTIISQDPQDVVWAARQLYEAGDYILQRGAPNDTYVDDSDHEVPIQLVLRGLDSALADVGSAPVAQLRVRAQADGDALLALFTAMAERDAQAGALMLDNWKFDVEGLSANVYRVIGQDAAGRRVERTGTDPETLLAQCKQDAIELNQSRPEAG